MAHINLPYGSGSLSVSIADADLGCVVQPAPMKPAAEFEQLIKDAIEQPIGATALEDLAAPGQRVAIVVDDFTRKTPAAQILPLILRLLEEQGIVDERINIIVASGTHRPMTETELQAKIGVEVLARYSVIKHLGHGHDEMLYLGDASNGIPAWVHRSVAEADLRIGIGMITPHDDAGFSGGSKIILPGVCSADTVTAFHAATAFLGETQLGDIHSPIRLSLEAFVAERVPLNFIVNVILNVEGQVVQCVAGDPVQAHRRGVEHARRVFGVQVDRRYAFVLANSYPYDVDFWQGTKGLFCGSLITEDGGCLILSSAAIEGNSNYPRFPEYIGRPYRDLQNEIRGGQKQDAMVKAVAAKIGMIKDRIRLMLVSAGLEASDGQAMGAPMFPTVEAALEEALRGVPKERRRGAVCVLPQAGVTLPMLYS